jgi:hypothetical protein
VTSTGFRCGDGTQSASVSFPELAANGTNYFAIYGRDAQSADGCIAVEAANLGAHVIASGTTTTQTMTDGRTCRLMKWNAIPDCDASTSALNYDQTTMTFSCRTISGGCTYASGAMPSILGTPGAQANLYAGDGITGQIIYVKFTPTCSGTIDALEVRMAAAPGSGKGMVIGLYNCDGSTQLGKAVKNNPSDGNLRFALSSAASLAAGTCYKLTVALENGSTDVFPNLIMTGVSNGGGSLLYNASTAQIGLCNGVSLSGTGASLSLPSTCPDGSGIYFGVIATLFHVQ